VWADFERSVSETSADVHINLGDLFDRPIVPYDVILRAARTYVSRDLERVSAFDVFAEIVWPFPNIQVVREPIVIDDLLLVPFDPITPTGELIAELAPVAEADLARYDIDVQRYADWLVERDQKELRST
jgi:hypothetical protein